MSTAAQSRDNLQVEFKVSLILHKCRNTINLNKHVCLLKPHYSYQDNEDSPTWDNGIENSTAVIVSKLEKKLPF
jgi:hypothetical protein